MDCRKFHRNLEDYLEGGLDFPGRFGMERHAQQCFNCGRELSGAQKVSQMAQELNRVSAPPDFEATVLRRIHADSNRTRFWTLRRFWIYGFDYPSWRLVTLGASTLALVAFGIFIAGRRNLTVTSSGQNTQSVAAPRQIGTPPAPVMAGDKEFVPVSVRSPRAKRGLLAKENRFVPQIELSEYEDYLVPGPGGRQEVVRLPKTILMRYGQPSEEYYIRNVSH